MGQYYPPPADICMICARYRGHKDAMPDKKVPGELPLPYVNVCVEEIQVCIVYPDGGGIPEDILLGDERPDCFRLNPDSEPAS